MREDRQLQPLSYFKETTHPGRGPGEIIFVALSLAYHYIVSCTISAASVGQVTSYEVKDRVIALSNLLISIAAAIGA